MRTILAIVLLLLAPATRLHAQTYGRLEETKSNINSYFYHVLPGEATVLAHVWGTIRNPGLYEVSNQTDLGKLLTLAGGPVLTTKQRADQREVVIKLFRHQSGQRVLVYDTTLDQMVNAPAEYPSLHDGDVVTVETVENKGFHWRDIFSVLGGIAATTLAIERLISLSR